MRSNSLRLDRGNEHFDVAKKYLLSGTGAPPRIYPLIGRPLYLERADGPYLYDLDGNRFIDFHNLAGAALLGHNHPGIKAAAVSADFISATRAIASSRSTTASRRPMTRGSSMKP